MVNIFCFANVITNLDLRINSIVLTFGNKEFSNIKYIQ